MEHETATAAVKARNTGPATDDVKERVMDFVAAASIEVTPHDRDILPSLVGRLPAEIHVYITHVPNSTILEVVETACALESLGFKARPHIVARRIENEVALARALDRMRDHGITRAMLIAGDLSTPAGVFSSTTDVLDTGQLVAAGVTSIGVAGHPEGHKRIGSTLLWDALRHKQDYGELTGADVHIVSQFGFNPVALVEWEPQLTEHGITLPVHVGIAGPATLRTLIRFAMLCGIGASLNALMTNLSAVSSLRHLVTSADEMLPDIVLAREGALARRFVQPHFFSFGGVMQTVEWLQAIRGGRFDIDPQTGAMMVHR